jgi:hypothetical protein
VRTLYAVWSWILFTAVVIQVGLAGYGAFYSANKLGDEGSTIDEDVFFDGFIAHAILGYILILAGLIFMIIGLVAGIGRWRLGAHGLLFGLLVLQMILAFIGFGVPAIGFFHPVNALLIFALSGTVAWREWRRRQQVPEVAPATP